LASLSIYGGEGKERGEERRKAQKKKNKGEEGVFPQLICRVLPPIIVSNEGKKEREGGKGRGGGGGKEKKKRKRK